MTLAARACSIDPRRMRRFLESHVARALLLALPLTAVACGALATDGSGGSSGSSGDGTSSGGSSSGGSSSGCGQSGETATITLILCAQDAGENADGGDAGDSGDAGDAGEVQAFDGGAPDAGIGQPVACFASCAAACAAAFPGVGSGSGIAYSCEVAANGTATTTCVTRQAHPCGRRFEGLAEIGNETLRELDCADGGPLGRYFAECAWLEAASVHAFRRLGRELALAGAPEELLRAVRTAAHDEIRHARSMTKLAHRFGARVPPVERSLPRERSLEEIATENAIEACVGETYGAAMAAWQSQHAADDEVRATFASIAGDELSHAALGWSVAEWLDTQLEDDARGRVASALEAATVALVGANDEEPAAPCVETAGVPSAAQARALIGSLQSTLWASA